MRALVAAIASTLVAACGGDDDGDGDGDAAVTPEAHFDLDVVVHERGVAIWVRDTQPVCEPEEHFPHLGQCEMYTDGFSCAGTGDPCARRVTVESDGVILGESSTLGSPAGTHIPLDPFPAAAADLIIERCGTVHRVPLPLELPDEPILTDLTIDGMEVGGTVTTSASATGIVAGAYHNLGGRACHVANSTAWRAPLAAAGRERLVVSAVRAAEPSTSPWGTVRLWTETYGASIDVTWPVEVAPDRWSIGLAEQPTLAAQVDGQAYEDSRWLQLAWEVVMTPSGPRHQLSSGSYFLYEAGETQDRVRAFLPTGFHTATIPHVTPGDELTLSLADNGHVQLTVGPVTMTDDNNPQLTHTLAFTVDWDHLVVPRPEP